MASIYSDPRYGGYLGTLGTLKNELSNIPNTYYDPTTKTTKTLWEDTAQPVDPPGSYKEDVANKYDPATTILANIPEEIQKDFYSGKAAQAIRAGGKARQESELARQYEEQFAPSEYGYMGKSSIPSWFTVYPDKKAWSPKVWGGMVEAAEFEKNLKTKIAAQDRDYSKAYQDVLGDREKIKTKSGVIEAGSAVQKLIAGGTGAGTTKTGKFKNIYQSGSMLPASWMLNRVELDPAKIAGEMTGIKDRSAPATGEFQSQYYSPPKTKVKYSYDRSKFVEPTLNKTGLGKYATISNLTPPVSSPQNYFSGGSSRFDEKTGKYL